MDRRRDLGAREAANASNRETRGLFVPAPAAPAPAGTPLRRAVALLACAAAVVTMAAADRAAAPMPATPQRRVVLDQIALPHHYYYREMYVPQLTSGPSAVDFTPDGEALVYSMQGSLWRQEIGSPAAEQLTDGPGYDYQPDVSPDGRWVVYASYDGRSIELRLLELASGRSKALTRNGAVQVEPRFSPDGHGLAFVSSSYEGRWHVFVAPFEDGEMGPATRVSEDHDSGLPRYYYSRFDHYLSPTWSPDGRELIVVSNRGHVMGTGGFWRMAAEPGGQPREIHYEETTWKARPDWSPDGRRVVYSSYLGRQWNQLWLMTAEGGDVLPITYGEFDATAPRWSPAGRRIAYVSNEGGNTSLWILELPGGARRRVEIGERRYRAPRGRLVVRIADAGGAAVPARISVTGADGRSWAPDDAWRHADDSFDRSERRFEYGYFHAGGEAELTVPAGSYDVEVIRGLAQRPYRERVEVPASESVAVAAVLEPIDDPRADGWYSGDLHVHMNYGGAYRNDPARLAFQAAAEDLDVVENLIVNKEQRIPDIAYWRPGPDPASTSEVLIFQGQEFHTSFWGHTGVLGLMRNYLLPDYAAYVNTAAASLYPHNVAVADLAHEQGALLGYVHPFDRAPDPADAGATLTDELPVDVALGKVDYLEVVGFSDHLETASVWYRLLNCGFRLPAGAGTDAMMNYASLRGPLGVDRVYVNTGGRPDHAAWLAGIRAGHTFATNGPLLRFSIEGREAGAELRLPAGRHSLRVRGRLRSIVPVDHLEIVANGEVVATIPLEGDSTAADFDRTVSVDRSGWYTLRAWSSSARRPVLDVYPFATTSPIWVVVGDRPLRSPADARYFLAWIERLRASAADHPGFNDDDERRAVLESIDRAAAVFRAQLEIPPTPIGG